jgi:hypothetical protein
MLYKDSVEDLLKEGLIAQKACQFDKKYDNS